MSDFNINVYADVPRVRVGVSASADCFGSLHARLILAGFTLLGDACHYGEFSTAYFEAPAGLDVDDVMRRLFLGFAPVEA